jgi:predicted regulator of Ras-like GTPase activity (Roadblock/LC7/MglB family)
MKEGKIQKLERIMENLVGTGRSFTSCVVTNERGLVVAEDSVDGHSSQTLAAMVSLMSDTAIRVSENLGYGHPKTSIIRGAGLSISIREFMVRDKWFRIGVILSKDNQTKKWFFRRNLGIESIESKLTVAAMSLRAALEE